MKIWKMLAVALFLGVAVLAAHGLALLWNYGRFMAAN